jgi:hypothetical protein
LGGSVARSEGWSLLGANVSSIRNAWRWSTKANFDMRTGRYEKVSLSQSTALLSVSTTSATHASRLRSSRPRPLIGRCSEPREVARRQPERSTRRRQTVRRHAPGLTESGAVKSLRRRGFDVPRLDSTITARGRSDRCGTSSDLPSMARAQPTALLTEHLGQRIAYRSNRRLAWGSLTSKSTATTPVHRAIQRPATSIAKHRAPG